MKLFNRQYRRSAGIFLLSGAKDAALELKCIKRKESRSENIRRYIRKDYFIRYIVNYQPAITILPWQ